MRSPREATSGGFPVVVGHDKRVDLKARTAALGREGLARFLAATGHAASVIDVPGAFEA